jgi:hypothetical protein
VKVASNNTGCWIVEECLIDDVEVDLRVEVMGISPSLESLSLFNAGIRGAEGSLGSIGAARSGIARSEIGMRDGFKTV